MHRAVVVQAFIPNTQGGKGRQMFVLQGQPGIQSESQPARVCKETLSWKTKKQKQPITPPEKKKKHKMRDYRPSSETRPPQQRNKNLNIYILTEL